MIPQNVRHRSYPLRIFILAGEEMSCKYAKIISAQGLGKVIDSAITRLNRGGALKAAQGSSMGHCPAE
jgi:hypothetical protein